MSAKKATSALIASTERERRDLLARRAVIDARLEQLDAGLVGLRALTGERPPAPARRSAKQATGTKALILDVLAGGEALGVRDIAGRIKVAKTAAVWHLRELVAAGDIVSEGQARSTRYRIP